MGNAGRTFWRGIYSKLSDVPAVNPEFGAALIDEMAAGTEAVLDRIRSNRKPYIWHEALALVAGCMCAEQDHLRVLDFGGGLGTGYLQLRTCLPSDVRLDYQIIDNESMCARGRLLFEKDENLWFLSKLPHASEANPDIVYVNSVLQYIEDYAAQIRMLAAFQAPRILFARLAGGDAPTFASEQINVPGQVIPHWFLNVQEVTDIMNDAGYRLVCDELVERSYDQSVFPETHRVEKFRNMLFARRSTAS